MRIATVLRASVARSIRLDGATALAEVRAAITEVKTGLETRDAEIKAKLEKAQADIQATGVLSAETKAALDALAKGGLDAQSRMTELEQKMANIKAANDNPHLRLVSPGEKFIQDPAVKAFVEGRKADAGMKPPGGRLRVVTNTITSIDSGDGGAGDMIIPTRMPGIVVQPDRTLTVRSLLNKGRTSSNSVEFIQESGFTNAAAVVAEAALKPESTISFSLESVPVRTIAHWMLASTQVLSDVPMLQSYIDGRLRTGLALVEEDEILSGDGTGQHLLGIIPQATAYSTARDALGDTRIDKIRRAMTQLRVAEYRASGIVMHPYDWEAIELSKDTSGSYIWANPQAIGQQRLWGLPVVDSTALEEGEFLVGAFNIAATIWDRQDAAVEVSTEDSDNFRRNLVTIRAEERLALTVERPESFIFGDFDTIVSS